MKVYVVIGLEDYKDHYDFDVSVVRIFSLRSLAEEYRKKLMDVWHYVDADIFEMELQQ
jgi:hypothetical protein